MFLLNLLDDMLFAAIPAVGFALVFNVPPKALKYCAILGALGHVTRTLLLHFGVPIVFATFFATCVIGFIGVHLSHRYSIIYRTLSLYLIFLKPLLNF